MLGLVDHLSLLCGSYVHLERALPPLVCFTPRGTHLVHRFGERELASVKGVNRAILDRRAKLASELSRRA